MTRWLLVAALVLTAAGCTSTPAPEPAPATQSVPATQSASATGPPTPVGRPRPTGASKDFHGTRWVLDHVVTDGGKTVPGPTGYTAYLRFDGGRATGSGGCGEFTGSMTEKANVLRFTDVTLTPIPCPSGQASVTQTLLRVLGADHVTFLFEVRPDRFFLRLHAAPLTLVLR